MGDLIFISGGCRSGKSAFALKIAEKISGDWLYLATCPSGIDDEMDSRIDKHILERGSGWLSVEEPIDLAGAIRENSRLGVILIDCLTLWVSNLMHRAFIDKVEITEDEISERCGDLICACREAQSNLIFVSNETGMGIVPDNEASRKFRDLLGRCNQVMASASDEAYFMVSGLSLKLK